MSEKLLEDSYLELGSTMSNHQAWLPLHLKPGLGFLVFQTLNEDAGFAKYGNWVWDFLHVTEKCSLKLNVLLH